MNYKHYLNSATNTKRRILPCVILFVVLCITQFCQCRQTIAVKKLDNNQRLVALCKLAELQLFQDSDAAKSQAIFDSISGNAKSIGDERMFWYSEYFKQLYYVKQAWKKPFNQLALLKKMQPWVDDCPVKVIKAIHELNIGSAQFECIQYTDAIHNFLSADNAFSGIGYNNIPEIGQYFVELQYRYYNFGDDARAIKFGLLAKLYPPFIDGLKTSVLHTLGLSYYNLHKTDSANIYFKQALDLAVKQQSFVWQGIVANTLGRVANDMNDDKNAIKYYKMAIPLCIKYNAYTNGVLASLQLAIIYASKGYRDSSGFYFNLAQQYAKANNQVNFNAVYLQYMASYYKTTQNLQQAYQYSSLLQALLDSINTLKNISIVKSVDERLKIEQNALTAANRTRRNQITTLMIILCIITLGIIAILYLKDRNELVQLNKSLQNQRLLILELERRKELTELSLINSEITHHTQKLSARHYLAIQSDLPAINNDEHKTNKVVLASADILENLRHLTILTEDDWHDFKRIFSEGYPYFFRDLRNKYPDFSIGDTRLLALIKLTLKNKEIADVLGISADSVKKAKYRLKKKINMMGIEEEPEEFVKHI